MTREQVEFLLGDSLVVHHGIKNDEWFVEVLDVTQRGHKTLKFFNYIETVKVISRLHSLI
ncbi:hypothetical protein [Aeromonas phage 4L372XY]|uniref:Uncharacterized protein n=1 Tax=Aeromonas phage 4L372XY TaxID=2588520 RepID=A0A5B9N868_9CAUD|nr:hypothetical protein HWC28_gp007 [Aeromonas phage 4L372XY]QEG08722.1 hypothetical protein [Aeromonas phage 4L372XY]